MMAVLNSAKSRVLSPYDSRYDYKTISHTPMSSYLDVLGLSLPAQTEIGKVRRDILREISWAPTPTTMVSYVSSNRVLIIAEESRALMIEAKLPQNMQAYLAILADQVSVSKITNGWNVSGLRLKGYLGRFEAHIDPQATDESAQAQNSLGLLLNIANGLFDHVIDCSPEPLIKAAIKPPGYYHIGYDDALLDHAVEQLAQMIGEFQKPRYFNYDPDICAHGSSGIRGCTRCIDACPTQAIVSIGNKIEVNPYLCQGGGSCASGCPSGAISYTYPKAEEQLEFLRLLLQKIRSRNNNQGICLLIYDFEHGAGMVAQMVSELPDFIIPFVVEDIGSVGLDLMTCALAYGANQVFLYTPDSVPDQVMNIINQNIALTSHLLQEFNLSSYELQALEDLSFFEARVAPDIKVDAVARFSPVGGKRNTIRAALAHLYAISTSGKSCLSLPRGSLFGQICVNEDACTLCMACVSVCPAKALLDGGESPALKFIEANCVQCGICESACPEQAIELQPRIHFEHNTIHTARDLKTEQPFRCVSCGKAFATQSMIKKMTEKLEGHWMFDDAAAMKRLQMCEDCRVIDVFKDK